MKPFDLLRADLTGTQLIEASAGTGKTYTIAGIYLRLILEKALSVEQILVVTFTNAATDELRDRIYAKLEQARRGLESGVGQDELVSHLIDTLPDRRRALRYLEAALVDFDRAAIFTIHGFCQHLLVEYAFETGSPYDLELTADSTSLIREAAEDFWRKHIYPAPAELIAFLRREKNISGPEYFHQLAGRVSRPGIRIVPSVRPADLESLNAYRGRLRTTADLWSASRQTVLEMLASAALNARIYGKADPNAAISGRDQTLALASESADAFFFGRMPGFPPSPAIEKFRATNLRKYTLKNHAAPEHAFFDSCDDLAEAALRLRTEMEGVLLWLKTEFVRFLNAQLDERKARQRVQFYDDLLKRVHAALYRAGNSNEHFVRAVRSRLRAALLDEFQDTDTLQYDIFARFFAGAGTTMFMIGDPKQSIYSFRGADIFTYLHAASSADWRSTLNFNWRSDPALIEALNTFFGFSKRPFLFDRISYRPVRAAPHKQTGRLRPEDSQPLEIWYLPAPGKRPVNKTEAEKIIVRAVAANIGALQGQAAKAGAADDIAVLVRTNRQARLVKQALMEKGLSAVLYRAGNVFDTPEAEQMERLLTGVAEVFNERCFRAALSTELIGVTANRLASLENDPEGWERLRHRFQAYQMTWQQKGFIHMFRRLLSEENIRTRLLGGADGKRRLTNLLQLSEILHEQSTLRKPGMHGLLKWFCRQRHPASDRRQIHELRLESDARAVKIVTIHMSKGLEYPIVFCPFCWEGSAGIHTSDVFFHDPDGDRKRVLDLGSDNLERHVRLAQSENLAESLRMLYVAVTRAKKKCHVVWGRINTAGTSALAWLFHPVAPAPIESLVGRLKAACGKLSDADMLAVLHRLQDRSEGRIKVRTLPFKSESASPAPKTAIGPLQFRPFGGRIDRSWTVTSYTGLIGHHRQAAEDPDRDEQSTVAAEPIPDAFAENPTGRRTAHPDIHQFPGGARTGVFFHSILQHLDFYHAKEGHLREIVTDHLRRFGFDAHWLPVICNHLQHLIGMPLPGGPAGLALSRLRNSDRINEMGFTFPLNPFSPDRLFKLLAGGNGESADADFKQRLKTIERVSGRGFMKGFVDLVFHFQGRYYIVDWKSNLLGSHAAAYHPQALRQTMHRELYVLQYYIYVLAVNRYLTLRKADYDYDRDFGGVLYVFLRGVDPAAGGSNGIYFDRPQRETVEALDRLLIPKLETGNWKLEIGSSLYGKHTD